MKIKVNNIAQLYAEVDLATNAGKVIKLSPGIYKLDATMGKNAGRLELQKDMTLKGVKGFPDLVIIDASKLPDSSFNPPLNTPAKRTGAIRMGRGFNKLEWIKVIGNGNASSLSVIDTDLVLGTTARIRIANTIITGGRIGINIRNVGSTCAGRVIEAEIINNEVTGNLVSDAGTLQGQGIVIQNANGASNAVIKATLKKNYVHGNIRGMRVFNNNGNAGIQQLNSSIVIKSQADKFEENQMGINLDGASNGAQATGSTVNNNLVIFDAQGTCIQNNRGIVSDPITQPCGIRLVAGSNGATGSDVSNNKVIMKLIDCKISGNQDFDIRAYGAFSTIPTVAGTKNIVDIHLQGISNSATVLPDDCFPNEPAGTNIVRI